MWWFCHQAWQALWYCKPAECPEQLGKCRCGCRCLPPWLRLLSKRPHSKCWADWICDGKKYYFGIVWNLEDMHAHQTPKEHQCVGSTNKYRYFTGMHHWTWGHWLRTSVSSLCPLALKSWTPSNSLRLIRLGLAGGCFASTANAIGCLLLEPSKGGAIYCLDFSTQKRAHVLREAWQCNGVTGTLKSLTCCGSWRSPCGALHATLPSTLLKNPCLSATFPACQRAKLP